MRTRGEKGLRPFRKPSYRLIINEKMCRGDNTLRQNCTPGCVRTLLRVNDDSLRLSKIQGIIPDDKHSTLFVTR